MSNRQELEKVFSRQINKNTKITQDKVGKLQGKSIFNREYEVDQKILYFFTMNLQGINEENENYEIDFHLRTIQYPKEIDELANDFYFIEMERIFPILAPIL